MTTIRVEEFGAVSCVCYYDVEVDDELDDFDAISEAIERVERGEVEPFDSSTSDHYGDGETVRITHDARVSS